MININTQVILFGDFSTIDNSPENIFKLFGFLKNYNFTPSQFQEIDYNKNPQRVIARPSFINTNENIIINIGSGRIDIVYDIGINQLNQFNKESDLNKFIENALLYIKKILGEYDKKCNRVAIVSSYFYPFNENKYSKIFKLEGYSERNVIEWNSSSAFQEEEIIDENLSKEKINIVVSTSKNNILDKDKFYTSYDINTVPENEQYRINKDNYNIYIESLFKKLKKAKDEFELMMK